MTTETESKDILNPKAYNSLEAIREHREALKKEIEKGNKELKEKWDDLFHPRERIVAKTRTQRLLSMANTGAGIIDGAIFGWKIYKKFKK